jgi:hypothetical protein
MVSPLSRKRLGEFSYFFLNARHFPLQDDQGLCRKIHLAVLEKIVPMTALSGFFVDLLSIFEWKFNGRSSPNRLFAPFSIHGAASPCEC